MAKRPKLAREPEPQEFNFGEELDALTEGLKTAKGLATEMKLTFTMQSLLELEGVIGELEDGGVDQFYADFARCRRVVSDLLGGGADDPQKLEDVLLVFFSPLEDGDEEDEE